MLPRVSRGVFGLLGDQLPKSGFPQRDGPRFARRFRQPQPVGPPGWGFQDEGLATADLVGQRPRRDPPACPSPHRQQFPGRLVRLPNRPTALDLFLGHPLVEPGSRGLHGLERRSPASRGVTERSSWFRRVATPAVLVLRAGK